MFNILTTTVTTVSSVVSSENTTPKSFFKTKTSEKNHWPRGWLGQAIYSYFR